MDDEGWMEGWRSGRQGRTERREQKEQLWQAIIVSERIFIGNVTADSLCMLTPNSCHHKKSSTICMQHKPDKTVSEEPTMTTPESPRKGKTSVIPLYTLQTLCPPGLEDKKKQTNLECNYRREHGCGDVTGTLMVFK